MAKECPLCQSEQIAFFQTEPFLRCEKCYLIFKDPSVHLSPEDEKKRYASHDNRIDNPGYVKFLTPALNEVLNRVPFPAKGLDYGCGPIPVLATLLRTKGYETTHYDPYFFPSDLNQPTAFDFIT